MEKLCFKKLSISILLALAFLATCLVFSACGGNKNTALQSSTDIYGFAGATAGKFLTTLSVSQSGAVASNAPTLEQTKNVETLNKYIDIFDSVVGNKAIVSTKEHLTQGDYNYKITTSITNLNGEKQTFVMKFKEVKTDNSEVKEDDDDEIESRLEGVMTFEGNDYSIVGEKSVENDEIEIEFRAYIDEYNYVEIEQSVENDEQEFEYSIYQNGAMIDSMSVEIEKAKQEIEVDLYYNDGSNTICYNFEREGNSLKISYEQNGKKETVYAKVTDSGDQIIYTFTDGNVITKNKV